MNKSLLFLLFVLASFFTACQKSDWRDARIGSYNALHFYETPNLNLSTGQIYGYTIDVDSIFTPKNIQVLKNDYADKYTLKIEGKYIMDIDKDGYCTLPNGKFEFIHDTLHVSFDNLSDTSRWGRYTYIGVKN